ncbi:transposase [Jiangella alkaliphila]|uniref:transposase n=1 Tax=Jiangella alkaliphila TaxID=419479 RepID=UPI0015609CAA|nr:transposase [Jiangella alkaliphila]
MIAAVKRMDTTAFHARARLGSVGRRGFDPDMLLTLFIYAMAHGVSSSRQIERLCGTDVAFRIICASDVPDHTVLARFRRDHGQALEDLLTASLLLATELGMVRLGTVAFDGTKIAANASMGANRSEAHLRKLARQYLGRAAATDDAEDELFGEDQRGDELPEDLTDHTRRGERISQALAEIERRRAAEQAGTEAERAAAAEYVAKAGDPAGRAPTGQAPKAADPVAVARARWQREHDRAGVLNLSCKAGWARIGPGVFASWPREDSLCRSRRRLSIPRMRQLVGWRRCCRMRRLIICWRMPSRPGHRWMVFMGC